MQKIALLDFDGTITEIQIIEDLQDTIQALQLTEFDYLNLEHITLPTVSNGNTLKYDRETRTFSEIKIVEPNTETQLDRIESMISKSQEQITQEARDAYTLELINSGII